MTMPAGTYYVGDLCYVLPQSWKEVCSILFGGAYGNETYGEFSLKDGRKFAIYSTAYGDGSYQDNYGHSYCVDSGTIGCIRIEDAEQIPHPERGLGNVKKFPSDFETSCENGVITFGDISINTDDEENEED